MMRPHVLQDPARRWPPALVLMTDQHQAESTGDPIDLVSPITTTAPGRAEGVLSVSCAVDRRR